MLRRLVFVVVSASTALVAAAVPASAECLHLLQWKYC